MIKRIEELEISLTPTEIAKEWCNTDSKKQAEIFNEMALIIEKWDGRFVCQMQSVTDEEGLTNGGRYVMGKFGEYAEKYVGPE